ncbi:glycerate kinase type-2 family protein [Ostreiculturibacter nitratireducens]|uniref:glycerate kinase type-2 family protein n=1 Tax=Ostreiculturibacter nitratireducens TaxID=3075226 RepID=UPI0031B5B19D
MTIAPEISRLRDRAFAIWSAGLAAADPAEAVRASLARDPLPPPAPGGRLLVIAVGKAARAMTGAALEVLRGKGWAPPEALVVTNYENAGDLPGATVMAAGHPVPDENGHRAAEAVLAALRPLGANDRVLALISGGGSALLPAPVEGVTLAEKAEVSRLLLASGAPIEEMNLVRQQLSRLKGGGMLRAAAPAKVTALILSDVVGDDLSVIASGPTVAPVGTKAEARAALEARGIWTRLPVSVRAHLEAPAQALPPLPEADNRLVGSNAASVRAMEEAGARIFLRPVTGDVGDAVQRIMDEAIKVSPGGAIGFGGETTVTIRGDGKGGRNQELALRFALLAEGRLEGDWAFLSAGTDGRDGPTEAAGGIVDPSTLTRMRAAGLDAEDALARNDSNTALSACDGLVMTGGTGTNVADLMVFVRG